MELAVALIGYGKIAKVHEQAIAKNPNFSIKAVVDPINNKHSYKHYNHVNDLLKTTKEVDLVCICSPNGLHYKQAKQCLEAGLHVLVEKPLTLSKTHALELVKIANEQQLRLFCSMQLRLSPAVQLIKKLIEQDYLGEIFMVNVQCFWNRNQAYYTSKDWHGSLSLDGGVLYTQFSHFIDVLNFWLVDLEPTHGNFFNFKHQGFTEFPDSGVLNFRAKNAHGNMVFTTATYPKNFESNISILAENGTIKIGDQYLNQIQYFEVKNMEAPLVSSNQKNFHPNLYTEVFDAIHQQKQSILDGKYAIDLVRFIEKAQEFALVSSS